MVKKLYDAAVKVGSYVDNSGREKGRYQNVGVVLEGKYGPYLLMNRYFNPAGVPCNPDKDSIIVSLFSSNKGGNMFQVDDDDDDQEMPF